MARAVAKGEPRAKVKERRPSTPHDETSDTLGNTTLCAVTVLYGVLVAIGYFSGATPEDTQIRALVAAAVVGVVGWLLTEIVTGVMGSRATPQAESGASQPVKRPLPNEEETA